MIKIEELRVGNLLKHISLDKEYAIVTGFTSGQENPHRDPLIHFGRSQYLPEHCEPIQVKEELIERFNNWNDKDFVVHVSEYDKKYFTDHFEVYYCGQFLRRIEYIHQLQNLYFDITGEEVQMKKQP